MRWRGHVDCIRKKHLRANPSLRRELLHETDRTSRILIRLETKEKQTEKLMDIYTSVFALELQHDSFDKIANFCLLFASMPVSSADRQPLTFAVVPQQAASKLAGLWTPILNRLGAQAGVAIEFQTAKDIPTFEQRLAEGGYDCAYMNPYHFTVFHENPGYEAVARAQDKRIKGILVTRKNSPIQNIEDLKGLSLAFPAPAAFAATILPQRELAAKGIDIESNYVSSHDSVYRTVARGLYPAGVG